MKTTPDYYVNVYSNAFGQGQYFGLCFYTLNSALFESSFGNNCIGRWHIRMKKK